MSSILNDIQPDLLDPSTIGESFPSIPMFVGEGNLATALVILENDLVDPSFYLFRRLFDTLLG